ncbi:hypothetical protein [Plantactinospora sp. KLBMP9567]|uniref:hypothetical protein n=1 Tax=Plantactinospora sp. KLBMP9567 TaxID=3085900 RepID=UPI002980A41E|nr:hypothetical protein [Plantactinospora sp. KLBMP9567]MDW5322910.1 hypothetical protein [Plantactinospora sp. KLBMP9567]
MPDRRRVTRVLSGAVGLAGVLAVAFLLAPPLGTDLSAQVARANFFGRHGSAPLDLGWYAGISPYGYSLFTPPLMHWLGADALGPRLAGALALLGSAAALALLMVRTGARRPLLGGLVGAACVAGNLVSGRITYAIGVAFGLLALLALTTSARPGLRWLAAGVAAALAGAASPVAGLFVGLAGVALALAASLPVPSALHPASSTPQPESAPLSASSARLPGSAALPPSSPSPAASSVGGGRGEEGGGRARWRPGVADGAVLAVGAGVPVAGLGFGFGAGGWMNISLVDTLTSAAASLLVALLLPRRALRIGAVLATLGVLAAFALRTPVGLNATRLAAMFALPVLVGYGTLPAGPARGHSTGVAPDMWRHLRGWSRRAAGPALAAIVALVAVVEPPVSLADLRAAGDPTASRSYFQPLLTELTRRPPGRIEVVPTANYWEAAYVPEVAPLARGWLRQADQAHNRLFLDGSVDVESYGHWLRDNGVRYVALAGAEPSWVGRREAELIRGGLSYLTPIWQHPDWTLYAVTDSPSMVEAVGSGAVPGGDPPDGAEGPGPGTPGAELVRATSAELAVDVPAAGETLVRLRWSRWLRVEGGAGACLARYGDWTALRVTRPGRYSITGSLTGAGPRCPG